MRYLIGLVALLIGTHAARADDDKVFSGPQPGEKLTPFKVRAWSGRGAGEDIELAKTTAPTLVVFVHEVTRPAYQLIRPVDLYASKLAAKGLVTHFVWLTADKSKTEQFLTNAKQSLNLKSPIGILLDGIEGPGNYGLNRKVTLTILVAKEGKTVANFAIIQPNETDAPKVLEALAKVMGDKAPTLEDLRAELDKGKPAGKGPPPELTGLMRRMIQKDNDADKCKKVADEMVAWAGKDRAKNAQLRDYCKQVVKLGYGTDHAKQELRRLAGDGAQPDRENPQRKRKQEVEAARAQVELAQANLEMWNERASWSERMFRKGFVSATQLAGDKARALHSQAALASAQAILEALVPNRPEN